MVAEQEAADRLKAAVLHRREDELDMSQMEVWAAGGPSNTTLTNIENARLPLPSRASLKKLDVGLQWEDGSAKRVLAGGEPTPLDMTPLQQLRRHIEASTAISEETRAAMLAAVDADERERRRTG